ncbi:acyltransferase [Ruminococcus sp.]|uniref:acyltransferase n=1 Tax=Ruminococcus sp. TaxID=41978 RepID=UPI002FDA15C1
MKVIKKVFNHIRTFKNRREFAMNSVHASDLVVRFTSHCTAQNKYDIVIGKRCEIKGQLFSFEGGKILIGNNVFMNYNSFIGSMEAVTIGNDVIIATNVRIFDNNNHPTSPAQREMMSHNDFYGELWTWKYAEHKPVVIGDNVWIGEFSAILKGVTIGKGSIVASHSVVTKDVPPYVIVAGNPARVVKRLEEGSFS